MEWIWDALRALVYGIVEGVTEWLPISSTGHLILLERVLPLDLTANFLSAFRVIIQLGAILAVIVLFWRELLPWKRERKQVGHSAWSWDRNTLILWAKIIVACIPAAVIGLLFDEWIEEHLYHPVGVALALIIVGVIFILVERRRKDTPAKMNTVYEISWLIALGIGGFQVLAAVFPGVSRSGATILGALLLGVSRAAGTKFTFFLGIPVMFGASLLKLYRLHYMPDASEWLILAIACVSAFLVSVLCIRFLMDYVKSHDFEIFGWYRIALGVIVLLVLFI